VILEIPCTPKGESHWTQRTTLAGRDYVLTFDWSQRAGLWFLTLADQDGSAIRRGIPVVANYPLLWGVIDSRRPPGELIARDLTSGAPLDPAFADLGTRFVLLYVPPEDLAA
jgi:hypothetical protein